MVSKGHCLPITWIQSSQTRGSGFLLSCPLQHHSHLHKLFLTSSLYLLCISVFPFLVLSFHTSVFSVGVSESSHLLPTLPYVSRFSPVLFFSSLRLESSHMFDACSHLQRLLQHCVGPTVFSSSSLSFFFFFSLLLPAFSITVGWNRCSLTPFTDRKLIMLKLFILPSICDNTWVTVAWSLWQSFYDLLCWSRVNEREKVILIMLILL